MFCSFATPNLSFWKLLSIPGGRSTSRPLPIFDRGMKYDPAKKYVLLETNEGDTPRIVVSLFSKSWIDPRRGSVPVSWSINPVLAEQFPALYDYFASTAGANDSFISGPGGCGYVHFEHMTDAQIKTFVVVAFPKFENHVKNNLIQLYFQKFDFVGLFFYGCFPHLFCTICHACPLS